MNYLKIFLNKKIDLPPMKIWQYIIIIIIIIFIFGCSTAIAKIKKTDDISNELYFQQFIYPEIRRSECGKCENLCHFDPKDRGGLTCVGIAYTFNKEWFVNELNAFHKTCKPYPYGIVCKTSLLEQTAKRLLYKKYAKVFEKCPKKVFALVTDSSVLEGQGTAKRHLRNAGGCNNFNAEKFTNSRITRFKKLRTYKVHGKGWIKRAKRKLRDYNK